MQHYLDQAKLGKATFKEYKGTTYQEEEQLLREEEHEENPGQQQRALENLPIYYYHPDPIGTSTFLTDANGNAYQFFLNLPFGETMAEQLPSTYYKTPFKFSGKEMDEETGLHYFGARYYDSRVSIWLSVDPLAEKYPGHSPFNYTLNNPINFIDSDGRTPYPITIRSFAPFNYFGGGFHGDGAKRGFTTSPTARARVHQHINFDTDKSTLGVKAWSSPTSHRSSPIIFLTANPEAEFLDGFRTQKNGDSKTFMFATHAAGANPLVPGSPNIDVFSDFTITENKKLKTLDISGKLTGDNFPSTEVFITDPSGQSVFLGVGFYEGSPFISLDGENQRPITNFKMSITTDAKGNFTGVKMGNETYTIEDWNKKFEKMDPHKNN